MKKVEYDGETYIYNNGKWLTSNYATAPLSIAGKLNAKLLSEENFEEKSVAELVEIIDNSRNDDNILLAAKLLEIAMDKGTLEEVRHLLPRLTSNYRKQGNSRKAIDTAKEYIDHHGKDIITAPLLTSVAAAYCDEEDYERARAFANRAYAMSGGNGSPELMGVYGRIKQLSGE